VYSNQEDSIRIDVEEDNKTVITVPYTDDHLLILPSGYLGGSLYRHRRAGVFGFVPSNRSKKFKEYTECLGQDSPKMPLLEGKVIYNVYN
jgi:hypothetical protein